MHVATCDAHLTSGRSGTEAAPPWKRLMLCTKAVVFAMCSSPWIGRSLLKARPSGLWCP